MTNKVGVFKSIVDRTFAADSTGVISCGAIITGLRGSQEVKLINSVRQFIDEYGIPRKTDVAMLSAIRYLNRAGFLNVVRVVNDAVAATYEISGEATFTAKNAGAWGNTIDIQIVALADVPEGVFGVAVYENDEQVELHEVSLSNTAKNGFGRSIFIEDVITNKSSLIDVAVAGGFTGTEFTTTSFALVDGADDTTAPSMEQVANGFDAFINKEDIDVNFLINLGFAHPTVQNKMLEVAEERGDCFAILDVPLATADDVADMIDYRDNDLGADTYFGGLFSGWLRVTDQFNDTTVYLPPSGDVAANWANTIGNGEFWLAALGVETGVIPNVEDVSLRMTEAMRTALYAKGINPVTKIGANVSVIMGQKSLQRLSSGLDRINVVNNVLWMINRLETILDRFVGRPNTKLQRDNANYACTSFLEGVKRKEGIYDFAVDTSDSINTAETIDQQEFYVDAYVQPTRIMEAINLRLVVTPTGVKLS
ncbi:tail sheath protein [Alishewanella phage vB_AspM_Slickus01]|nr:tail sheath protein [Alishewanella phage vB_AspM_Slickus01]